MAVIIDRAGVDRLIGILFDRGFEVIGPTVSDGAIVYARIASTSDLPVGTTDRQGPGTYRLEPRDDEALFGYVVGPRSWKQFLHPPEVPVWIGSVNNGGIERSEPPKPPRYAFFAARPCEIAAISVQDRVFLEGPVVDDGYAARRRGLFIVAVNCTEPASTCFCTSMETGPLAHEGHDLAITELLQPEHRFIVESATVEGDSVLADLGGDEAEEEDRLVALEAVTAAARRMERTLDTTDLKELLYANAANPHWDEVAARCLSCTNCTRVCPTCFCTSVGDELSLDGTVATRTKRWDSCFSLDFSYIHGGYVRSTPAARYRQWLTHKLASWQDQFGVIGCVGCGRCITWCPVGIDITAEVRALRGGDVRLAVATAGSPQEEAAP